MSDLTDFKNFIKDNVEYIEKKIEKYQILQYIFMCGHQIMQNMIRY